MKTPLLLPGSRLLVPVFLACAAIGLLVAEVRAQASSFTTQLATRTLQTGANAPSTALVASNPVVNGVELPARLSNSPGMRGLVYGFFEDRTGERMGRLRIDRVEVEYRRQGFLRVAWRPLVVLAGVTLDIGEGAKWPSAGAQILNALQVAGGREACLLRNVRLRLSGSPVREIVAPAATVRADGGLELQAPVFAVGGEADAVDLVSLCFWLAGPRAGQLTPPPGTAGGKAATLPMPESFDPTTP